MDAVVGQGKHIYRVDENWAKAPVSIEMKPAAVAVDSKDRVFCFNRAKEHPDIVYVPEHNGGMLSILSLDGERLARWGAPIHKSIHGVWGDSERSIYVVQPGEWGRVRRIVKYTRQ